MPHARHARFYGASGANGVDSYRSLSSSGANQRWRILLTPAQDNSSCAPSAKDFANAVPIPARARAACCDFHQEAQDFNTGSVDTFFITTLCAPSTQTANAPQTLGRITLETGALPNRTVWSPPNPLGCARVLAKKCATATKSDRQDQTVATNLLSHGGYSVGSMSTNPSPWPPSSMTRSNA